jgi:CBS-domain-containing membrane protein
MKAMDVMTRQVISVGPESSILEVAQLMLQHSISGLPVVDATGRLVGIVTEGDFLRRSEIGTQRRRPRWLEFILGPGRLASEYANTSGRKVNEVMTTDVKTVVEDTPLEEVVHLMERYQVKRLPVLRERDIVGIITRANLFRAVIRLAYEAHPASADDNAIRERLLDEIRNASWAPTISVAVKNGKVQLTGLLSDERQRHALRVAAENIPGVKDVEDNLIWIDPAGSLVLDGS